MDPDTPDITLLEARLGYSFKRRELLVLALTHPSRIRNGRDSAKASNQRLEFLGDAVLNLVVSELLYERFPDRAEGFLTRNRAALVKGEILVQLAERINLDLFIRVGKAEKNAGARGRLSRLEDALEAVTGAVYLDGGLESARSVIGRLFGNLDELLSHNLEAHNSKGRLQEFIQEQGGTTSEIDYVMVNSSGPDHERSFSIQLKYRGEVIGEGIAGTRKAAESIAAREGLKHLHDQGA